MTVFSVAAFGICAALLAFLLKAQKNTVGQLVCVAASIGAAIYLTSNAASLIPQLKAILDESGYSAHGKTLIKALGIALVSEGAADICRDLGENSVAAKIELAGKMEIVALAVPLASELLAVAKNTVS